MRASQSKEAGFTLVEMLISIFIFSLISVGTMTALTSSLRGKAIIKAHLDQIADVETARSLMVSDFSNIILHQNRDLYGGAKPYVFEGGIDTLVTFTRTGRPNPGGLEHRGDLQRVSYVLEGGNLIRRSLAQTNPVPLTPTVDRVMFNSVARAKTEFVSNSGVASFLQIPKIDSSSDGTPAPNFDYISLTIVFENGDELVQYFGVEL